MVALLVLMLVTVLLASRIARQEALRDVRVRSAAIATLIAGPLVNTKVRARVPGAGAQLTMVMRNRMSDGSVLHVRLWNEDGEVIWADEKQLVGRRFPVTGEMRALFGTTDVTAEVTDLSKSGNISDRKQGEALQVYSGALDGDHTPMVFEASFTTDRMRADQRAIINGFLPIVIAALLLFQLAVLPLALSLARRVERGLAERSIWMRHALLASDLERRRIAQDLHDGVIQDLAGLSYVMPTLQAQLTSASATPAARATSRRVTVTLSRDIAALRAMITDIYPPDLAGPGFVAAIQDLARGAAESGVAVRVEVVPELRVSLDAARLTYRIVREALRNIDRHAEATTATVQIRTESEQVLVCVSDNGRGIQENAVREGHLGLRLLEDTVGDLGGQLTLRSSPAGGAILNASFPVNLVEL